MGEKKYVEVYDLLKHLPDEPYKGAIRRMLHQAPASDVVEVVRCGDCKHMILQSHTRYCTVWNGHNGLGDDGFCNYGERKSE